MQAPLGGASHMLFGVLLQLRTAIHMAGLQGVVSIGIKPFPKEPFRCALVSCWIARAQVGLLIICHILHI